jgi:hypothetical protein
MEPFWGEQGFYRGPKWAKVYTLYKTKWLFKHFIMASLLLSSIFIINVIFNRSLYEKTFLSEDHSRFAGYLLFWLGTSSKYTHQIST